MNIPFYTQAISSLRPGCAWRLVGDDDSIQNLEWSLENKLPPPSQKELIEEAARLQQVYENNQYQRDRAASYPSIEDQLDTLYHQGYDGWKASISEVKTKYPKPEGVE
jgi:hypothetical protein